MNKLALLTTITLFSCGNTSTEPPLPPPGVEASRKAVVSLGNEFQTIHSFGASDCWSAKFIGKWADESKKNQIADLLFSLDTLASGQPKGIGLSLWRMNIGAGSFEQGEASNITDEWRREECFQTADGKYDWNKQAGGQWFLNAARKRGVPYSLGFSVSPPVHMTLNGKAFSAGGNSLNIKPDKLPAFASFLVDVANHFELNYISPLNEPQWDWKAGENGKASQEGSPALNTELIQVAKALSEKLVSSPGKSVAVMGEAAQIDYLYAKPETSRGNQLNELFSANSPSLNQLPKIERMLAYHSYFTTCDDANLVNTRRLAASASRSAGVNGLWQSEFGILGDICGKYNGYPRNTGIDYGLYVAKVIHNDLAIANVTSWQWWLAISPYDYSDALVYINGPDGQYSNHNNSKESGLVLDSKQLWAFGNYARFIRPGMKRVGIEIENHTDPVTQAGTYMLSAYKDEATKKLVLVAVNMTDANVTLPLSGVAVKNNQFTIYTTSRDKSLAKMTATADKIQMEPKSVTTLVGYY